MKLRKPRDGRLTGSEWLKTRLFCSVRIFVRRSGYIRIIYHGGVFRGNAANYVFRVNRETPFDVARAGATSWRQKGRNPIRAADANEKQNARPFDSSAGARRFTSAASGHRAQNGKNLRPQLRICSGLLPTVCSRSTNTRSRTAIIIT